MADITKIKLNGTDYNVKDPNAQPTLVSGTNIKTINNESILGEGNIDIQGGGSGTLLEAVPELGSVNAGDVQSLYSESVVMPDGFSYEESSELGEFYDRTGIVLTVQFDSAEGYYDVGDLYLFSLTDGNGDEYYVYAIQGTEPGGVEIIVTDSNGDTSADINMGHDLNTDGYYRIGSYVEAYYHNTGEDDTEMVLDIFNSDSGDAPSFQFQTSRSASGVYVQEEDGTYTRLATEVDLSDKQDTLVSGENIKTINNQSILGSGNITIQGGGGGGGETVVELTKAQYEALDPPASDTTYIITDAETVDLNDYAMASGLTELSGTVQTLSTTVSGKADKQSVTARASNSNYLPGWNSQGVITGSTAYYSKSQGINGTSYYVFSNSNTNHPAIFAPTSSGTAGQPLISTGRGEPHWGSYKFAFLSQSAYDALSTKDSTTIYFIVDPN